MKTLQTCFRLIVVLVLASCSSSGDGGASRNSADAEEVKVLVERLNIGNFESRGILRRLPELSVAQPIVVMLPGSGPSGPEEALAATVSADGQESLLFNEYAKALNQAGFATLQLGKPGVDYHSEDPKDRFYDLDMAKRTRWSDLVENAKEAIRWARRQPWVDSDKILLLGHSEGTQVAVDIARVGEKLQALILLGYQGHGIQRTLEFQFFDREILWFVNRNLDENRDGKVTREEAAKWKEFNWTWAEGQTEVAVADIERAIRGNDAKKKLIEEVLKAPLYAPPFDAKRDYFDSTASLGIPVLVFTGELDLQTPASDATLLERKCEEFKKTDCFIHIVPGVGHAFSVPRGPRAHPWFDITLGPPEPQFLNALRDFSAALRQ